MQISGIVPSICLKNGTAFDTHWFVGKPKNDNSPPSLPMQTVFVEVNDPIESASIDAAPIDDSPADGQVDDRQAGEAVDIATTDSDATDSHAADESIDSSVLEALLFGSQHPLTAGKLAELMDLPSTGPIRKTIRGLNEQYETTARSFRIEQVAGGFQMLTLPKFGEVLRKLHQREIDAKLTKAALETLAIIAYKQPILRADVEAIRGRRLRRNHSQPDGKTPRQNRRPRRRTGPSHPLWHHQTLFGIIWIEFPARPPPKRRRQTEKGIIPPPLHRFIPFRRNALNSLP